MALRLPSRVNEPAGVDLGVDARSLPDTIGGRHRPPLLDLLPRGIVREGVVLDQHIREGRFQRSLALITGFSSLLAGLEVAYEHYRGSYSQRIMYSPVLLSPALLVAAVGAVFSRRVARTLLPIVSLITIVDGVVGFVFHVRGVQRKPGGWRIPVFNVVMGPPVLAPLLFAISGYLGVITALLRREDAPQSLDIPGLSRAPSGWLDLLPHSISQEGITLRQHVREGRFQKQLAVAAALTAFCVGLESLYSHYKNRFMYWVEWIPIVLTPVMVVAGIGTIWSRLVARTLLPATSLLALLSGAVGTFFHLRGLTRRPGGIKGPWTTTLYNVIYGPPIFAPLLFSASGFMGLLASLLRRGE